MSTISINGNNLSLEHIELIARSRARTTLSHLAVSRMKKSKKIVDNAIKSGIPVYGLNTGFGKLADKKISSIDLAKLQKNLLRSHAAAVGPPLPEEEVRAMMLLRANALACGYSGVRPVLAEILIRMLNKGVHPLIPEKGSVGASGDLAQLAHLALVLIGEGKAQYKGRNFSGNIAMKKAGIKPLILQPKEGLALINGTQAGTAVAGLALLDAQMLIRCADISGALSIEAVRGSAKPFSREISEVRPHPGQIKTAANIRRLFTNSEINRSHKNCGKIQEPYSMRCIPQVHGAVRDAITQLEHILSIEINSATDNPLVFPSNGQILSGGNFHGEPLSLGLAYFNAAMTELASISERRIALLIDSSFSGLPPFLARQPGLESGMMIAHVTATALVSECKILSHPAAVDSIPTSAGQEDHVSMSYTAARMARSIISNLKLVLAIELMAACAGIDFLYPLKPGPILLKAYKEVRGYVLPHSGDRILADDILNIQNAFLQISKL